MLAEMRNGDKRDVLLVIPLVNLPPETSHPNAIVGTTMMTKLFA